MLKVLMTASLGLLLAIAPGAWHCHSPADPISGKWGSDGQTLLELAHDGKGRLTGTTYWIAEGREVARGPIESGTFNSKTGAFRLEGDARSSADGTSARFVIEGKVGRETATGTYELRGQMGEFAFKRIP